MAHVSDIDSAEAHEGQWFNRGKDHDKPVRYRIRPVPASVNQRLRTATVLKGKMRANLEREEVVRRTENYVADRATYALLDTENFSVAIGDDAAAAVYRELLKDPSIKKGDEVFLDGKWNEEIKGRLFGKFRRLAAFVSDRALALEEKAVEGEEEDAEDF